MKNIVKIFFLSLMMFFSSAILAQTMETTEKLISKEWRVNFYEIKGEKTKGKVDAENDKLIFYSNHVVKGTEEGTAYSGTWKYDGSKNTLTIFFKEVPIQSPSKIFKLTDKELVLESVCSDGTILRTFMISE